MFKQGLHCFYQRKVFRYMEEPFPRLSEDIEKFRRSTEEPCESEPITSPMDTPLEVGILQATRIILDSSPLGCYYCLNKWGLWVGIDNRTGDAWCEAFETKEQALEWLQGN